VQKPQTGQPHGGLLISHTHHAGTVLEGTDRGDGTQSILVVAGWRWSRTLGAWYVRGSRDHHARRHLIDATAGELRSAGYAVRVDIDDQARPTADVEVQAVARRKERVAALTAKAARQGDTADRLQARAAQLGEGIPFGQPVLVDHHSAGRDIRLRDRIDRTRRRAIEAQQVAAATAARAEAASHTTSARYSPETVANRVDHLTADLRAAQRRLDGYSRTVGGYAETYPPATGPGRVRLEQLVAELTDKLGHWTTVRAGQAAACHSRQTVRAGDLVQRRGREWHRVIRANTKTVTVPSPTGGTGTVPYAALTGHRSVATHSPAGSGDADESEVPGI